MNALDTQTVAATKALHVFETCFGARRFQELTGEKDDSIIHKAIGWQLGSQIPQDAIAYLWTANDATGQKWQDDAAATTKATLKRIPIPDFCRDVGQWLDCIEATEVDFEKAIKEEVAKAMADAESVVNTDAKTDRDYIIAGFKAARELSEIEYQAALRENDLKWHENAIADAIYAEETIDHLTLLPRESKIKAFEARAKDDDDKAVLDLLTILPRLDYEHLRECGAKRLACRPQVLDKLIEERRKPKQVEPMQADRPASNEPTITKSDIKLQGSAILCPNIELWPHAVDGPAVFHEIAESIKNYVASPEGGPDMLVLWAAHTYVFDVFPYSPRLHITSPDRGCGKSTLRDVAGLFVNRPLPLENMTSAVAFRLVEKHAPTLLVDEVDGWLKDNEELGSLLNSGYKRGTLVARCEGDDNEPRLYSCFAPAVLCGIGNLRGTLHDRSIVVRLTRAKLGELQARFDSRRTAKEKELCRKLARWMADNRGRIAACDPKLPDGVFNRLADNWRPLFGIAEVLGGEWPKRCAEAFVKLTGRNLETESYRVMVLADIQPMVQKAIEKGSEWLASSDIIDTLLVNPERPWNEANRGKPVNERWLARKLDPIKSGRFRDDGGNQARGYRVTDIQDAIERFVHPPVLSGQASHTRENGVS